MSSEHSEQPDPSTVGAPAVAAGRPGVTQDEVANAMATLERQNRKTSLREIRSVLKRGSQTTIARHRQAILLEQIRTDQRVPESSEAFDLEGLIRDAALTLYGALSIEAAQMAEKDSERTESACNKRIESAERAIEDATDAAREATIRSEELRQQIDVLKKSADDQTAQITTLTTLKHEAEKSLAVATSEHGQTTSELSAEIMKLQEDIAAADVDLETNKALLKTKEKASADEIARLKKTIEEERKLNGEYGVQLSELQAKRTTLEQSLAELNAAMNQLSESANVFESQAQAAQVRVDEIQQENSLVYKQVGELKGELGAKNESHAALIKEKDERIAELKERVKWLSGKPHK